VRNTRGMTVFISAVKCVSSLELRSLTGEGLNYVSKTRFANLARF